MIEDYSIKPSHLGGHLNRTNLDRPLLKHLKKNHNIDAQLVEGMSRVNKIDYWMVCLNGENIDIHSRAVNHEPDFIDKPDMLWNLEEFEKDNF